MRPKRSLLPLLVALLFTAAPAAAQVDARLLRHPDVSETRITFVYGNDVRVVPKEGGTAHKLSSPAGEEAYPRFSPDGQTIAFTGHYDGNADLYTIPVMGGTPTRVTHHPEFDRMVDWYPDGDRLLYASEMTMGRERGAQFHRVDADGGLPAALPMARAAYGDLSPSGDTLVFTPKSRLFSNWKRYRGGRAADVWLFDLSEQTATRVTDHPANDEMPMWAGDTIYFLSDRGPNQRYNIWAHNRETGEKRQVTEFADFDVDYPSIGPSDLVFQAGGELYRMDLESENVQAVDVRVVTDQRAVKPKTVAVGDDIQHMDLSPSGERALFQARGNVYTVPAEHGPIRQLTRTSGVAERYPSWAPDGSKIAYFSDASGAYNLTMTTPDGQGGPGRLTSFDTGFRYQPQWGPNSDNVVFVNHARQIRLAAANGALTTIDTLRQRSHGELAGFEVSWSPNGRWITYSRGLENGHDGVFLYDTEVDARYRVTSNFYNNSQPVFGPMGRYLFLTTDRHHEPVYSGVDNSFVYPNMTKVAAVPLRDDVPSPLAPKTDTVATKTDSEGETNTSGTASPASGDEPIAIDRDDFEQRMVILPPPAGIYPALAAAEGKVIYHRAPRSGSGDEQAPLVYFDLEAREEKTVVGHADAFELSADGSKLLVASKGKYDILEVAPEQKMQSPLRTDEMTTRLDPRAEWGQIFSDVGRFYRDYFYDPNLHGVDWTQMRERYGALIDDAATRSDVNFLIGELIGELNASHTYVGGGDTETPEERDVGLLGVNWAVEEGVYQIAHVVEGAPWDVKTRSPLDRPGVDVEEGDYVLAVNGAPMDTDTDPWAALAGHAGETVALTVNDEPTREGARTVLVETMRSDDRLRYLEWVNQKRQRVAEATDDDVGYIYVPNTGPSGQSELVRQFRAQTERDALIIDERFNGGGALGDRFIELLDRRRYSYLAPRHGPVQAWPPVAHTGPQAMLINGLSGSGGDAFPWYFKQADRGPVVGTRTWGGLIGPTVTHGLIDGGAVTVPPTRLYGPDGEWFAEGHGVEPDLRVENDPQSLAQGEDPQLRRAIRAMEQALEDDPPSQPDRPSYEDRTPSGAGQ
jgi:tricorn protease